MDNFDAATTDKLARTDALDRLVDAILAPTMLTDIAMEWGVTLSRLRRWIAADPTRSARVREARRQAASIYAEQAERAILDAKDDFELKQAKELAHHLRWKASKADPGEYGEKIEVGAPGDFSKVKDEELAQRLNALIPGMGDAALVALEGGNVVH